MCMSPYGGLSDDLDVDCLMVRLGTKLRRLRICNIQFSKHYALCTELIISQQQYHANFLQTVECDKN